VDSLGRFLGAGKRLSVFAFAPIVLRDRASVVAIAVFGCLLLLVVCWMIRQPESEEINTPILSWKGRSGGRKPSVDPEPPDSPPEPSRQRAGLETPATVLY
jgi:hypothetical protein